MKGREQEEAGALLLAAVAGVAYVSGARPDEGLFWLYAVLPVAIGLFAEQFRILAAQTVLDARGLEDAQAVGRLPDDQQRSVVDPASPETTDKALVEFCHVLLCLNEFVYVD